MDSTAQRTFLYWLARGLPKEDAATRAGLVSGKRAFESMRRPEFVEDLREAIKNHLVADISPRAILILTGIMDDAAISPRVRVDAAKTLLDRAGITSAADTTTKIEVGLHELSQADLFARAELELAQIAASKTIEGEIVEPAEPADADRAWRSPL
jgi:hypothetical protein